MIPSSRGRRVGLIFLLLVLVWFFTRKGEPPLDSGGNSTQIEKTGEVTPPHEITGRVNAPSPSTATVKTGNSVPIIRSIRLLPIPVSSGQSVRAEVIADDKDGDFVQLLYAWEVNGKAVDGNDHATLDGGLVRSADQILVTVTPADPYSRGEARVSPLTIVLNLPPEIVSLPPNKDENGKYTYQIAAKDPDLDALNYNLLKGPPGMEIGTTTGFIQWAVTPLSESQSHVAVEVNDGKGGKVTQQFRLQIVTQ